MHPGHDSLLVNLGRFDTPNVHRAVMPAVTEVSTASCKLVTDQPSHMSDLGRHANKKVKKI